MGMSDKRRLARTRALAERKGKRSPDAKSIQTACLLFLSFAALFLLLRLTRSVMVPFAVGVFLYLAVTPLARALERFLKIPRFLSWALTVLVALVIAAAIVFLVVSAFQGMLKDLNAYRVKVIEALKAAINLANSWLEPTGRQLDAAALTGFVGGLPFLDYAQAVSSGLFGFFGQAFLAVLFFVFLVAGGGLRGRRRRGAGGMANQMEAKISAYVGTKFLVALGMGTATGIVLLFIGVDMAVLLGFMAFLLDFIPSVGSTVAMALPLPVAFLQFGLSPRLFLAFLLPWLLQTVSGNFIEPRVMGESMGLHPVAVLLSLLLWGFLWGIPGMIMAVPITAVLKIILARWEITKPVALLLEGRWGRE